jgi:hypothetical protein
MQYKYIAQLFAMFLLVGCIKNRYSDFCFECYPPDAAVHEGNCDLTLEIRRICEHDGHQFDWGPNEFDMRITDTSDRVLMERSYTLYVTDYEREADWNVRDTLVLKIWSTRYDFDIHDHGDSTLVLHIRYALDSASSLFKDDSVFYLQK